MLVCHFAFCCVGYLLFLCGRWKKTKVLEKQTFSVSTCNEEDQPAPERGEYYMSVNKSVDQQNAECLETMKMSEDLLRKLPKPKPQASVINKIKVLTGYKPGIKELLLDSLENYKIPSIHISKAPKTSEVNIFREYFQFVCSVSEGIRMISDAEREYYPIEPVRIVDKYGQEAFDLMFGLLKIKIIRENNESFPSWWKLAPNETITFEYYEMKEENDFNLNDLSLLEWLRQIFSKEQKVKYPFFHFIVGF